CEAARIAMKGYTPPPAAPSDWITDFAYKVLMGDLRPAAWTFPSTWQLLPQRGCVEKVTANARNSSEPVSLDARSLDFWRSPLGLQLVDDPWKKIGTTSEVFWAAAQRAEEEATRSMPDPTRHRVRNVRAFYSGDYP